MNCFNTLRINIYIESCFCTDKLTFLSLEISLVSAFLHAVFVICLMREAYLERKEQFLYYE